MYNVGKINIKFNVNFLRTNLMKEATPSYHHGNLRTALLEKAKEHLIEKGPDKISLRALAREVGVSQTAPYRHFPDKTMLLAALAAEGFKQLFQQTHNANIKGGNAQERLQNVGCAYVEFAVQNPDLYRLMFGPMIPADTELEELDDYGGRSYEVIVQLITDGVESNEFTEGDPLILANSAWALVHGVASLVIDNRFACTDGEMTEQHIEQVVRLIGVGLVKR